MNINENNEIKSYSRILAKKHGEHGTEDRDRFHEKAMAYYTGQIIEHARKDAQMTQEELAEKIGADKSYISRIENGKTEPKVSTFYKIMEALGFNITFQPS
ncbi:helix-turn-helix domain-containing protein [Chryseobacterium foetidum]|uniref:helix-turn-helix domain-containing protein n=1 Tax=Chryseobacterium foetidum TaxID=2951057 RepID=UPI0021C5ADC5|nr:helix-turn-helix transcriptional regulator [Chryseobacterium foetidum]